MIVRFQTTLYHPELPSALSIRNQSEIFVTNRESHGRSGAADVYRTPPFLGAQLGSWMAMAKRRR